MVRSKNSQIFSERFAPKVAQITHKNYHKFDGEIDLGTSHIIVCAWIEIAVMHYMLLSQLARVRGLKSRVGYFHRYPI